MKVDPNEGPPLHAVILQMNVTLGSGLECRVEQGKLSNNVVQIIRTLVKWCYSIVIDAVRATQFILKVALQGTPEAKLPTYCIMKFLSHFRVIVSCFLN